MQTQNVTSQDIGFLVLSLKGCQKKLHFWSSNLNSAVQYAWSNEILSSKAGGLLRILHWFSALSEHSLSAFDSISFIKWHECSKLRVACAFSRPSFLGFTAASDWLSEECNRLLILIRGVTHRHIDLAEHLGSPTGIQQGDVLWRRHDYRSCRGQRLFKVRGLKHLMATVTTFSCNSLLILGYLTTMLNSLVSVCNSIGLQ